MLTIGRTGTRPRSISVCAAPSSAPLPEGPSGGSASAYLDKVAFVPLPAAVRDISAKLISKVSS